MLLGRVNLSTLKSMDSLTLAMANKFLSHLRHPGALRLQGVPVHTQGLTLQIQPPMQDLPSLKNLTSTLSPDRLDAPHSLVLDSVLAILKVFPSTPRATPCNIPRPTENLSMVCPLAKAIVARGAACLPYLTFLILQRKKVGAVQCLQATPPLVCLHHTLKLQDLRASLYNLFSLPTLYHLVLNATLSRDLLNCHAG